MSRETDVILLRFGICIFWSSSLSFPGLRFIKYEIEYLLKMFFRFYSFQIIKLQYKESWIDIYCYRFKKRDLFLRKKHLIQKLNFCRNYRYLQGKLLNFRGRKLIKCSSILLRSLGFLIAQWLVSLILSLKLSLSVMLILYKFLYLLNKVR